MTVLILVVVVVFAAITAYALYQHRDVEVSFSLMRRWLQFTLVARTKDSPEGVDKRALTDSSHNVL